MLAAPVVGLALGSMLVSLAALIQSASPGVVAALSLFVWVAFTGALHLDGLADCADAWVGGHGDRNRTMEILKDSRSGPVAITVLTLLLIGKFAALEVLVTHDAFTALVLAPILGRAAILAVMLRLPYVRPAGIGKAHADHMPRRGAVAVVVMCSIGGVLMAGWLGVFAVLATIAVVLLLERSMRKRLRGCTGDALGASCELVELVVLLTFALGQS